jgi:hypothetical protein
MTIMAIMGVAVLAIGASLHYEVTRTKADEIDKIITQSVPAGSSVEHINAFLAAEGFEHTEVHPFAGNDQDVLYGGIRTGEPVIVATLENPGHTLELVDIKVAFALDETGVLRDHVVYEHHYQPEWLDENLDSVTP